MAWQGPSGSRGGLSARSHLLNQDQVQIRIDPGRQAGDFDAEVESLHASVKGLKQLTYAIDEERKLQGEMVNSLDDSMQQAKAALSRAMRRLNIVYKQAGSWHLLWLVIFAVVLLTSLYVIAKVIRFGRAVLG